MRRAVIGIGNPLRRDDGIGIILVKKLREEKLSDVICIDAGTGGIQLLPILSNYDRIIIVDAVNFNGKPGETKVFNLDEIKIEKEKNLLSIHMMNIIEVI
ncbi:MAG: hydrogenase maturation protease, partial [Thermoplasmata archaeon]